LLGWRQVNVTARRTKQDFAQQMHLLIDVYFPEADRQVSKPQLGTAYFACGNKTRCNQMISCEEARSYLTRCSIRSLDKDGNGVPCEALCK
jgi:hypothetical protein